MNNHLRCDRAYSLKGGEEFCSAAEFGSGGVMKISQPAARAKQCEAKSDLLII